MVLEAVASTTYFVGLCLTLDERSWRTWTLAIGAAGFGAHTARRERTASAWVASGLVVLWSWSLLDDIGVRAVEAYAAPLAAVLLGVGLLRRSRRAGIDSWNAFTPALVVALGPALLAALADETPTRPVLFGIFATGVLLWGVGARLQAPLVLGSAALVLDVLAQLGPVISALPRWLTIGALGALLLGLGVTYEARLRDLRKLQARIDALG